MRTSVKICGLTTPGDARFAAAAGADYLGFVFFPASRRCLSENDAAWIRLLEGAPRVGVFRDQPPAFVESLREAAGLTLVQLHGSETARVCEALGGPEKVVKAVSVGAAIDWGSVRELASTARILFDTASPTGGGTGRPFDWNLLHGAPEGIDYWLAGGLRPENVGEALRRLRPSCVDVASGVESSVGIKDPARIRAFIDAVHAGEET